MYGIEGEYPIELFRELLELIGGDDAKHLKFSGAYQITIQQSGIKRKRDK